MRTKDDIKEFLDLHPEGSYTYRNLIDIAYVKPMEGGFLYRVAQALADELDRQQDKPMTATELLNRNPVSYLLDTSSAVVHVTVPPLRPGDILNVSTPDAAFELKGSDTQQSLMTNDPVTGDAEPYPSHAGQYRKFHGKVAWLFNPWTGVARDARDIGSDVFGSGIKEPANVR